MAYRITVPPEKVLEVVGRHMLIEGYRIIPDLEKSKGTYLYDAITGRRILDMFGFFATLALGHNHEAYDDPEFRKHLEIAAITNPSNSDFYTVQMATFLETLERIALPEGFKYLFFISGGALAVENALKVAMDWKVRKNFQKGYKTERGHQVMHFREAFHGRSGYTLSLTNTTPEKTQYFAKFNWPRITNPKITFPLEDHLEEVEKLEKQAIEEMKEAFRQNKDDICAIIIEPIQGEGGDNHFRPEFFKALRELADENEAMLIFDEVQTGVAATGKFWAYQHFGITPDIIAFGKKMQVCGIMVTERVDEVPDNVFHVKGRINSTWGGSLVDMVRATKILQTIDELNLVEHNAQIGQKIMDLLFELSEEFPLSNIRGRGTFIAFDLPSTEQRNEVINTALEEGALLLQSGTKAIRFRPPLTISEEDVKVLREVLTRTLKKVFA
ncbi:MAG: L-lysine 6-transaminase [Chlorobi bacterium]|nr:L-lysine 6-transaminase [Chlorobiota bacterium]